VKQQYCEYWKSTFSFQFDGDSSNPVLVRQWKFVREKDCNSAEVTMLFTVMNIANVRGFNDTSSNYENGL
jgi:hypothetical protein